MVQGRDNDGIDLAPGNGTQNRSQSWQPVPALCDADYAINLGVTTVQPRAKSIRRSLAQLAPAIRLQVR